MKRFNILCVLVCAAALAYAAPNISDNSVASDGRGAMRYEAESERGVQESVAIVFKQGSNDGTGITTSTSCSTIVSDGDAYLSGNVADVSKAYYAGINGLKLGTSSAAGTITLNLTSAMTPTYIVVRAKRYNSSTAATIKVNGKTVQNLTADFADYTFALNGSSISYIKLDASKYCWISSVTLLFPHHTATFSVNGNRTSVSVQESMAIPFPSNPESIGGKVFCGWATSSIDGTQASAPTFVGSAKMGTQDITYYAVYTDETSTSLTITPTTPNVPASYGGDKTFAASTLDGVGFMIQQMYATGGRLQWRSSSETSHGTGTMYNSDALTNLQSVVITYDANDLKKNFTLNVGNTANPVNGTSITATASGNVYTYDCSSSNSSYFVLTNGVNAGYLTSIVITYMLRSNFCTEVTTTLTLNANGYATYCFNCPLDFTSADGFSAWQVTGVSGSVITFARVSGSVAAGTGLLLMGNPNAKVTLTTADSGSELTGNLLEGVLTATHVEDNQYFGLKGNAFVKVNAGTVPAGKALLPASVVAQEVKSFTFNFEGADGISAMPMSSDGATGIYNLSGQRVQKPRRGVNIINGKKVLVQ